MGKEPSVVGDDTIISSGKSVQRNNLLAARIVANTIKSTLGPKGMDKLLVDSLGDVTVTNDGATILRSMAVEHPVAKMLVEIAATQEQEIGDGTTSAVVIAGELLRQAELLLDKQVHPTVIAEGYQTAMELAVKQLKQFSATITVDANHLLPIATTAMTGKSAQTAQEHLAPLCVQAALQASSQGATSFRAEDVKLYPLVGRNVHHSALLDGAVIERTKVHAQMPDTTRDAKVALLNLALELRDPAIDAKISITSPEQIDAYMNYEESVLRKQVDQIIASGATVVCVQKGIDEVAQHMLAKNGIYAIRRVRKSDMDMLAKATGAHVISSLSNLSAESLGKAGTVSATKVGNEQVTIIKDCSGSPVVTLLLHAETQQLVDELTRSVEDVLGDLATAISSKSVVAGAGAIEIALQRSLSAASSSYSGKKQLAIRAFANALEVIPSSLAENAGLDSIDVLTALQAAHEQGNISSGVSVEGGVIDALRSGIVEPMPLKLRALQAATQVAIAILRIDDMIAATPFSENDMPPDMRDY